MTPNKQAWNIEKEWIKPLNEKELKAFDKLSRAYAKEQKRRKISRAYSTGNGGAVIVRDE